MQTFLVIWIGQLVSTIGSGLTSFSLGIWIYQQTGSTMLFALVPTLMYLPGILISPFVGVIVDRFKFKKCLIFSDMGAGLVMATIAILFLGNRLQIWHVYCAIAASSLFAAFQWTAYSTATAILVSKQQLTRANALVEIAKATAKISAPVLATILLSIFQLQGVLAIDFLTFIFSVFTLLALRDYKPQSNLNTQSSWQWHEMTDGLNYIIADRGLLMLMIFFAFLYFTLGLLEVLFTPLVLSIASTAELGVVLSLGGCGWLIGGIVASIWGGPKRRINGIILFSCWQGLWLFLGGLRPSLEIVSLGIFGYLFAYPFIASFTLAIWQAKVPVKLQGRVFAIRLMFEWLALPCGYLAAGFLAEQIFEPLLMPTGILASTVGTIIGTGTGRGIGFLFMITGAIIICFTAYCYSNLNFRSIEDNLII
jgi:MFS transporter, DHA3 family, macrolide efflux protein